MTNPRNPNCAGRQPRTFPSVAPVLPRVVFIWPSADATENVRGRHWTSSRLAWSGLDTLRPWSVFIFLLPARSATWWPDDGGSVRLRVVVPGQLTALQERYRLHRETEPRVMPGKFQLYGSARPRVPADHPRTHFSDDWLTFRIIPRGRHSEGKQLVSMIAGPGVARVVRRAMMKFSPQPVPEALSGHRPDGTPGETEHLAVIPLPFVGSCHADGSLKGIVAVLPRSISEQDRRTVYRAVANWELSLSADELAEGPPAVAGPSRLERHHQHHARRRDGRQPDNGYPACLNVVPTIPSMAECHTGGARSKPRRPVEPRSTKAECRQDGGQGDPGDSLRAHRPTPAGFSRGLARCPRCWCS